jgi:hypothetical protein
MTIKELIKELSNHPNQNAIVKIIANTSINGEVEELDYICNEVEVWDIDNFNENYIALFTYEKETN